MDPDQVRMEILDSRSPGFVRPALSALFFKICVLKKLAHPAPTPFGLAGHKINARPPAPIPCGHPYLDAQLAQARSKSVGRPGGSPDFLVILKKKDFQVISLECSLVPYWEQDCLPNRRSRSFCQRFRRPSSFWKWLLKTLASIFTSGACN